MDAKKFWFYDFIATKRTFVIPVYQRLYDWKADNCAKLFDDIKRIVEGGNPHFIGTFVHREIPAADTFRELVIIDGQQRITSLILFAKAIYDLTDDDDLKTDIRSTLIKHSTGELRNQCKLRPIEYDRNVFEKLMSDEPFAETNFDDKEKDSALYTNYLFFRKKISASSYKPKELYNATGQLTVVSIMLDENEDPQEIFESLNSTGLALTKADLIRNKLFMSLAYEQQEELYKSCWREIEKLLRPLKSVELFMIQYLIVQFKSNDVYNMKVSPSTLYDLFKRYLQDKKIESETCLKDMLRYAKLFRRCIFDDATTFANLSALNKKFYELTFLLKAKNAPIILMYLLDRHEQNHFDEETFIKFVDALISLTFRAKVCGTNGITQQFAGNVLARLHKNNNQFWDENFFWRTLIESSKVTFPNDKDFQAALISNKLYISSAIKSDGCKYLLYSLERQARVTELPSYAEATVEHILPQKLNADWKNYLATRNDSQAHEIFLHTLGNLTLTGENSTLGNADFDAKKEIYSRSNFSYTRKLIDYDEWTSKQIQARAKKLAALALKIWTLPKEFNSVIPDVATVFRLDDSDFSALTGRRLATLSIFDTEIKMPSWIQMLQKIVLQLYALDKDIFRRATQQDNVPKNLFTTEPTSIKLDEDFYMTTTRFDTKRCLKFAKNLTENFDALGGTNFKDDIWFTLRPAE